MVAIFAFIDFQHVFADKTSWCVPKFNETLKTASYAWNMVKRFHNNEAVPVATAYIPPKNISGIWKEYFDDFPDIPTDPCNKIFNIDDTLLYDSNIDKLRYSGFSKWKPIELLLKRELEPGYDASNNNILYLTGVATDCCVLSTALEAIESGIKVYIIKDACAAGTDESHENALKIMSGYSPNIEIIDSSFFCTN